MHTLSVGIYAYFISRHAARAFGLVQVDRQRQPERQRQKPRQRQRQTETEADRDRGRPCCTGQRGAQIAARPRADSPRPHLPPLPTYVCIYTRLVHTHRRAHTQMYMHLASTRLRCYAHPQIHVCVCVCVCVCVGAFRHPQIDVCVCVCVCAYGHSGTRIRVQR